MIRYDKYKSSEINWLGYIPNDWEVKRVKDLADYQSGYYIDAMEFDNEAPYPVYGGNGIRGYCNKYNHFGDYILIGRQGALCGNINYAKDYFWATEHAVVVYKKKNINITWLGELLRVMNLNQYALSAAQPGLSVEKIRRLELPFVPFETQNLIADFINIKTQAIDKKINLLIKKANYYKEYRKSLINETVCKGLNKNVKLKFTELDFSVSINFLVFRLKDLGYLYSGLSGKSGSDFNQEENPNNKGFIPFTNIANNTYLKKDHLGTVVVSDNENQNKVKKEDIFFLMSSESYEDIGKSAILDDELNETYLNSFCKGYRVTNRKVNPYFLNYLLLSDNYRQQLIIDGKGFTRINLKMEKVNDFIVFIPNTIEEQNKIVSFLDNKTQTIDKIVSNINTQIQTLKELRKTLINDAVTGKIKITKD